MAAGGGGLLHLLTRCCQLQTVACCLLSCGPSGALQAGRSGSLGLLLVPGVR
jgi:hypothetical protein